MTFLIEPATAADIPFMMDLEDSVFLASDLKLSRRAFSYHLRSKNMMLMARQAGKPVAYILVLVRAQSVRVYSLAVDPLFQGKGVARLLLNHILAQLRERAVSILRLEVRISNKKAIALYESLGFEYVDIRVDYYADGEEAYCMALKLES